MRQGTAAQADGTPRRPLGPRDTPRSAELIAGLVLALVLAHLLLAQLTLVLAAVLYAIGQLGRWRLSWLAVPAGVGALWVLAIGPSRAGADLAAGPRHVLSYLGGIGQHPGRLLHPQGAFAGLTHWLPEQLPLALILAAAEAFGLFRLQARWRERQGAPVPPGRPGLIIAARRAWTTAALRAGGVVTRDGCCLGVEVSTGRAAAISWREAEGGVLCTGSAAGADLAAPAQAPAARFSAAESGFTLAHAAIRRRKPLIVIDLAGPGWLAQALAAACAEPGAPLSVFGAAGPGCYEPLRGADPARAAALVMAMLDWSETGDRQRRSCAAYLIDALAVQGAAVRDRAIPVLDDLVPLLSPGGLRERAALIPAYHPRRDVLTDRAAVSADLLDADPAAVAVPLEQLPWLRSSPLGQWLRPVPPDEARVSLGQTVRQRGVTLFSLSRDGPGRAARMIAGLAAADLMAVCAELAGMSVPSDSLVWINGCEVLGDQVLADLVAAGQGAGMAVVLGTAAAATAERLAAEVNVLVARGPVDPALVGRFAGAAEAAAADGAGALQRADGGVTRPGAGADTTAAGRAGPAVGAALGVNGAGAAFSLNAGDALSVNGGGAAAGRVPSLGADGFALLARGPRLRVLTQCRYVPAPVEPR